MDADELRMVIVINDSVKMSRGKVAAQAGHVVQDVTAFMVRHQPVQWAEFVRGGCYPKIVLRATAEQMEQLEKTFRNRHAPVWCASVHDFGRTDVAPDTLTAIAFCPMKDSERPDELKKLKLL
jgi:PTH2 family peptidyl-tRNA hydrolase